MKKIFTILFSLIILSSSCTYIITKILGLKKAKPKSIKYIRKFAEKRKLGIVNFYTSRDSVILRIAYSRAAKEFIFRSDGKLIDHNENTANPTCGKNGLDFIKEFQKGRSYPTLETKSWIKEQGFWQDIDKKPVELIPTGVYDLMIVYYWGTFVGRPNLSKKINQMREYISSRPELSIYFVIVNIDLRKDIDYDPEYIKVKPFIDKHNEDKNNKRKSSIKIN